MLVPPTSDNSVLVNWITCWSLLEQFNDKIPLQLFVSYPLEQALSVRVPWNPRFPPKVARGSLSNELFYL